MLPSATAAPPTIWNETAPPPVWSKRTLPVPAWLRDVTVTAAVSALSIPMAPLFMLSALIVGAAVTAVMPAVASRSTTPAVAFNRPDAFAVIAPAAVAIISVPAPSPAVPVVPAVLITEALTAISPPEVANITLPLLRALTSASMLSAPVAMTITSEAVVDTPVRPPVTPMLNAPVLNIKTSPAVRLCAASTATATDSGLSPPIVFAASRARLVTVMVSTAVAAVIEPPPIRLRLFAPAGAIEPPINTAPPVADPKTRSPVVASSSISAEVRLSEPAVSTPRLKASPGVSASSRASPAPASTATFAPAVPSAMLSARNSTLPPALRIPATPRSSGTVSAAPAVSNAIWMSPPAVETPAVTSGVPTETWAMANASNSLRNIPPVPLTDAPSESTSLDTGTASVPIELAAIRVAAPAVMRPAPVIAPAARIATATPGAVVVPAKLMLPLVVVV